MLRLLTATCTLLLATSASTPLHRQAGGQPLTAVADSGARSASPRLVQLGDLAYFVVVAAADASPAELFAAAELSHILGNLTDAEWQPGGRAGAPRVISDCHFSVQLNHFIPVFLSYSVAVFRK